MKKKIHFETSSALFSFTEENEKLSKKFIAQYPKGRESSAVLAFLDLAQRQNGGWLSKEALVYVAERLSIPLIKIYEIVNFYTLFRLKPCGKNVIQVCTTTPCWLRGSEEISEAFQKDLSISVGEMTGDNLFSLEEVECLGACEEAPVVQINDDYYGNMNPQKVSETLKILTEKI